MEETSIIIIGCGPTGALLSSYLGRYGVKNIVIEREDGITTDPRGIAVDEEGMRIMQGLSEDVVEKLWKEVGIPLETVNFLSMGTGHYDLSAKPWFSFNTNLVGTMGHPTVMCHKQPVLERCVRDALASYPSSELRSGCTVEEISEDEEFVYAKYVDSQGAQKTVKAKFLVGADGKTGFTRKFYLEPKGILMQSQSKLNYEETWVAINLHMTLPTPETHPDFPLFKKGYTSEQVYDAFFPKGFRMISSAERSIACGRFGLTEHRLWRFEFVINKGEDGWKLAEEEQLWKTVGPWLTHPGSRYGLNEDVAFPKDCMEVLRSRPYTFLAKSCNKWALGRVILCGDAAHVFPPFGGQGIASGFRDSVSLAWRLSILTGPSPPAYVPFLKAWYLERKQQLDRSLALTIKNGEMCTERNPVKIILRNWVFSFLQFLPGVKEKMGEVVRKSGLTTYKWQQGMPFCPQLGGGMFFPQVFCEGISGGKGENPLFSDDVIYSRSKKNLFQLVVLADRAEEVDDVVGELYDAKKRLGEAIGIDELTVFVNQSGPVKVAELKGESAKHNVFRILLKKDLASKDTSKLPEQIAYDGTLIKKVKGKYVVLRPDRFIFASCTNLDELLVATKALGELLGVGSTA